MTDEDHRDAPILVTGSHRSGTTWVGRTLAYARGTLYIHEPLNPDSDAGLRGMQLQRHYTYISPHNEKAYAPGLDRVFALDYQPVERIRQNPGLWSLAVAALRTIQFGMHRFGRSRPIIKDPIAFFSAPWIHERYRARIVILIRHPAAFASSLKGKNWTFDFGNLLGQEELMASHLETFRDDIRQIDRRGADIVDQSILLWNVIYSTVHRWQTVHPGWLFIRHEDLSLDPLGGFESMFSTLNLTMTDTIRDQIREDTSGMRAGTSSELQRDSRANITRWKNRLTDEEIERVRSGTSDVWSLFYDESDW